MLDDNSELGFRGYRQKLITQQFSLLSMIPCVIEKFQVIFYIYGKNNNSELRIHLMGNSEFSKFLENLKLWLWLAMFRLIAFFKTHWWSPAKQCFKEVSKIIPGFGT